MVARRRGYLASDAHLSEDGVYRYWLSRRIGMGERAIAFVGLNPSTADGQTDDPTVRREVGFAASLGFDWYRKVNLYAYRATDPAILRTLPESVAIGPENDEAVAWVVQKADVVVAAWGGAPLTRSVRAQAATILGWERTRCLGQNADGSPVHPLYLPKTTPLRPWVRP